jgi:hypothetical protein
MKQIFTLKSILSLAAGLFMFVAVQAQQTVTKKVAATGGDYTTIFDALMAISSPTADPVLAAGDQVILNIDGTISEATNPAKVISSTVGATNIVLRVPLKITIQGTKADQSIISGSFPTSDGRLWQFTDATIGGSVFTFKNLNFKNFGGTLNNTGANGAILNLSGASTSGDVKFLFENVIFSNCSGTSLFSIIQTTFDVEFNNCLFRDITLTPSLNVPPSGINGMINKSSGGNFVMKNCTFFNNTIKPGGTATTLAGILRVAPGANLNLNLVLENNQVSNTVFESTASTLGNQALFGFTANATPGTLTYSIKNNVCIGNVRPASLDADFYFQNLASIPFVAEANIVNSALERLGTAAPFTYPTIMAAGFIISPNYTYTSPEVNYEMDGALPKLVDDANKIGHFKKLGTAATQLGKGEFRAYSNRNGEIRVEGAVSKAAVATLYDIQGRVVKVQKLSEGNLNTIGSSDLSSAVYLLKVKDLERTQTIKVLIGN